MNWWARRRQLIILLIIFTFLALLAFGFYYFFLNKEPTCFDGSQNGTESGIDCGGACDKVCYSEVNPISVLWSKVFPVDDTSYSAVAYIENSNSNAVVRSLDYTFSFFSPSGEKVSETSGNIFVPSNHRIGIFEGPVRSNAQISKVEFSFNDRAEWYKDTGQDRKIRVENEQLIGGSSDSPRVAANLINTTIDPLKDIEVVVIVYDDVGNPVSASKTFIERIEKDGSKQIVFTWPGAFKLAEKTCEVPIDVALVIDRSGSMNDDGGDPPQPLTAVKNSAQVFVDELSTNKDQVAVVSFATTASTPIDIGLSSNKNQILGAIDGVEIGTDGIQHTNIADGLDKAKGALSRARATTTARRAVVLLTDGIATHPQKEGDSEFPENSAISISKELSSMDTQVYTIGLGENVNPDFLENLATSPEHFFLAPTTNQLTSIYTQIAESICSLGPKVVEIIPTVDTGR